MFKFLGAISGGIIGALIGSQSSPNIALMSTVVGAIAGAFIGGRFHKKSQKSRPSRQDGEWYNGLESSDFGQDNDGGDDGGADD